MSGYDPKCYELAEYFLSDIENGDANGLAEAIQDAVENWFAGRDARAT